MATATVPVRERSTFVTGIVGFVKTAALSLPKFFFMVFLLGLSLLPLSALLMIVPIFMPQESILSDTVKRSRNPVWDVLKRIGAFLVAIGMLLALLAFATEIVTRLNLKSPYFGLLAGKMIGTDLVARLPEAMSLGWPYVILIMYGTDLLLLASIGKVPLSYNYRNLLVRWRITLLTGLAFTVVIALLTVMLGFVNGLNELTANSGVPGNVIVMSEGATDELFSNLGYGDVSKLELERATIDKEGNPLSRVVSVKSIPNTKGGDPIRLVSKETYFTINQRTPVSPGAPERRRFAQLRGVQDSMIAGKVHNITLLSGEWFPDTGSVTLTPEQAANVLDIRRRLDPSRKQEEIEKETTAIPCTLGEGAAVKFGDEQYRRPLKVGDVFLLGELAMHVNGIMKSEGSIYGSEVWSQWKRMGSEFRKESYTTVVMRVDDDTQQSAEAMAAYLSNHFASPRVTARSEPKYFEELSKGNQGLLSMVIIVAIIMALGGVFGVMNTMFAAIAQRIKDIGVLRILGFKRWQILVSFMLESLGIAILGGLLGVLIGSLADGAMLTSNVSSGQGGKTVIMKVTIDADVVICGVLFTIVMGRLGGLVPSLSAMRLGILQSLK
jgi:ABC-type lipoprotein release transport system permease subunit